MFEFRKRQIVTAKDPDEYEDTSSEGDSDDIPLARKLSLPQKPGQKATEIIGAPPSSASSDGASASRNIEDDQEIESSEDVGSPQKSDDPRNDDLVETGSSVNFEEHADLVETGETRIGSDKSGEQPLCLFIFA